MAVELRILGPLEVRVGADVVPLRTGRPRKLLAALVLRLGERVSTDTLIDVLWHDASPVDRVNALRILVSHVRKALAATGGAAAVETVEGGYRLVADPESVDANVLRAAVSAAGSLDDPQARLDRVDAALAAWRGPPVPELASEEFAQADVQHLGELRLAALEQRTDALLALGRHAEAAADLQQLVVVHPLRERFYAQLMTALYRSGRQADALAAYARARRMLSEELGLDPGPELQSLEQAVLTHSCALDLPGRRENQGATDAVPRQGRPDQPSETVPLPLEPLIGREGEVARLTRLTASSRLVTLTGPGGAGKTRLAAELVGIGRRQAWWVDLSGSRGHDQVVAAVAAATRIATPPGADGAALAALLADRDGVLVLDTCEQVRAPLRPVVEALLRAAPGLSILATSRQPLGAATETSWPVPPLSLPDPDSTDVAEIGRSAAVRLFVERAAARRPGFALTPANCVDVARVCLLLDGLPLAIELAAAHAAVLDVTTMVRVLDDRLRLLVDGTREDRQHALRSTIAWSYELLSGDEAVFFERLSVFAGPFPLEAAVAVAGDGLSHDGLELLLALARQSLVTTESAGRFRLLDTIRAFAGERFAARGEDVQATSRRHATWYADLLSGAGPTRRRDVEGWRGELPHVADLRRALEWCFSSGEDELGARMLAALWWLWPREGAFEEAAQWFPRARAVVAPGTALQADLLASSATHAVSRGDLATGAREGSAAVELYERLGHRRSLAWALIALGIAHWGQGDYAPAAQAQERGAEVFAELRDDWGNALMLVLRARTAIDAGEPDAMERLDAAESAARSCGDLHVLATALMQRARAEVAAGDPSVAVGHAQESLRLNVAHGHREGVLGSLHALGLAHLGAGRPDAAGETFARALRDAVHINSAGAISESLDCLGVLAAREHRWADAARLLAAGQDLRSRRGIRRSRLMATLVREAVDTVQGRLAPEALARAREDGRMLDVVELATRPLAAVPAEG